MVKIYPRPVMLWSECNEIRNSIERFVMANMNNRIMNVFPDHDVHHSPPYDDRNQHATRQVAIEVGRMIREEISRQAKE